MRLRLLWFSKEVVAARPTKFPSPDLAVWLTKTAELASLPLPPLPSPPRKSAVPVRAIPRKESAGTGRCLVFPPPSKRSSPPLCFPGFPPNDSRATPFSTIVPGSSAPWHTSAAIGVDDFSALGAADFGRSSEGPNFDGDSKALPLEKSARSAVVPAGFSGALIASASLIRRDMSLCVDAIKRGLRRRAVRCCSDREFDVDDVCESLL